MWKPHAHAEGLLGIAIEEERGQGQTYITYVNMVLRMSNGYGEDINLKLKLFVGREVSLQTERAHL